MIDFLGELKRDRPGDFAGLYDLFRRFSKGEVATPTVFIESLGDDIFEFIKGDARVLWFADGMDLIVCSHGLIKKSQKTPKSEIARARTRRAQYFATKLAGKLTIEGTGRQ